MYKKFLLSLLIVTLSNIDVFSQDNKSSEKHLTILNKTVDFGDVSSDTVLTAKFFFVNNGTKEVNIEHVKPDCTCTNYTLSQNVINPSDTAYVELSVNTSGRYNRHKIYSTMKADTYTRMINLLLFSMSKENEIVVLLSSSLIRQG
jgi:hypothetical protein